MATITPVGYNTGSTISGTLQYGNLAVADTAQDYGSFPNGVRFWATPDQDLGYVIAKQVTGGNQPNPLSVPAFVGFNRCPKTDSAFINLSNTVTGQNFTGATQAATWLLSNGYWTSYTVYPSSLLIYLDTGNSNSYPSTGTTWFDLTQDNNNATLINTPTYSATFDGILQFDDASSEYATVPNIGSLSAWTVEAWFRLTTSLNSKITSIVCNEFDLINKLNFSIGTNNQPSNANLAVGFFDGAWRNTTGFVPATNVWYQVVGTYDGSVIRQYVNGSASGGTLNYVGNSQSGGEIRLMRRWDSPLVAGNLVDGDLAIIKVYNTALSSNDILNNFNSEKSRFGL